MIQLIILIFCLDFASGSSHLLLTQVVTQPNEAESFSIYNPTETSINLKNYYICDDEKYYQIQTDGNSSPSSSLSGFTAKFPDMNIDPYDTLVVVLNENYKDFYGNSFYPNLFMFGTGSNSLTGSIGFGNDKIDHNSEQLILFKWNGDSNQLIQDIDYFVWSGGGDLYTAVDKSNQTNYQNDTNIENQLYFEYIAENYYSYSRIDTSETGENLINGNGIDNHNETSENFRESWTIKRLSNFIFGCNDQFAINYNPLAQFEINLYYENSIGTFEFDPNLFCKYSFKPIINNEINIGSNIKVYGRVVDFFDIRRVSDSGMGPQNITIEDDDGYRITITVWDWEVSNSSISQIQTKYNQNIYYLWANGNLGYYEEGNEWQVEPLSIESIILAHSSNYDGEFIANSIESKTAINPEPYVIIPTLGETLDYNFSFPDNSRVIVRIFDISGRFVTSLIDKYYEQSGTVYCNNPPASWDGKNHLGQIMNPGTYIMHIEAMNPNTGKTETDASPIVVGVKN